MMWKDHEVDCVRFSSDTLYKKNVCKLIVNDKIKTITVLTTIGRK